MQKKIKIFSSFEEQEVYKLEQMANSTVEERFRRLHKMQQMHWALHPFTEDQKKKKIIIRHGFREP